MRFTIAAVGRIRAGPERDLQNHYAGRLRWKLEIREVEERKKLPTAKLVRREAELLSAACPADAVRIALDGTGRQPVENAVIVIEAGRFKAVRKSGAVRVPAGAAGIDVTGRTILPGFIDGHGHLEDFHGELYLHLGITTCAQIETGQDGPWSRAQKEGVALGKIRGPRIWMSGLAIGGVVDKAADGSGFVRLGRHQRGQEGDGPNAVAGSIQKSAVHRPSSHLNPSFVSPTDQLPGYVHRLCTHLT